MPAYAPAAIHKLYDDIHAHMPAVELSGILGDQEHFDTGGYHVPRDSVSRSDYSVQYALDLQGDGEAASALDIKPPNVQRMEFVSGNLMRACKANDPRLHALREWFGTMNGERVTGWDRHNPNVAGDDSYSSSDDSHLWHVHLSFYRAYANDYQAIRAIGDVVAGIAAPPAPTTRIYVIRGGDTYWTLEVAHHWPHGTLLKLNPALDPGALLIGQAIRVPA